MEKCNQSGRTMIEVIMVIGIIGVLSAASMQLVGVMLGKWRNYRVTNQVVELQKVVSNRFAAVGNYKNLSNELLIKEKIAPHDMISKDDLVTRAGGNVSVYSSSDDKTMHITFEDLTKPSCIELSQLNWTNSDSTDLYSISINNDDYFWPKRDGTTAKVLPIDISAAVNSCSEDKNVIDWVFY